MDIEVAKRLHDAHRACLKLMALTQYVAPASYHDDETLRLACERLLGIVGEVYAVPRCTTSDHRIVCRAGCLQRVQDPREA